MKKAYSATLEAVKLALENGYELPEKYPVYSLGGCGDDVNEDIYTVLEANVGTKVSYALAIFFIDPLFWKCLGKGLKWERQTLSDKDNNCLHCGISIFYQPPKEYNCLHAQYPEACTVCSAKTRTWEWYQKEFLKKYYPHEIEEMFFEEIMQKL